ncbi:hypothetical protein P9239_20510 [Caballeronia sp. LZ062]|uniref:hypothetical protein n=1 Tax=Caballeronia sp. LZ062 TaxID=3038557 RepID=UPI002865E696|nr:hypothetical protein [Caballeronia sp. LZ062]MDR5872729.1 hypothetical protein [Caballeronia sp. LZ062]
MDGIFKERIQAMRSSAPPRADPPSNKRPQGEFLVRNEVGDMVKQLHELRRRLTAIETDLAQEAIEAVVNACFELDEFLRSNSNDAQGAVGRRGDRNRSSNGTSGCLGT